MASEDANAAQDEAKRGTQRLWRRLAMFGAEVRRRRAMGVDLWQIEDEAKEWVEAVAEEMATACLPGLPPCKEEVEAIFLDFLEQCLAEPMEGPEERREREEAQAKHHDNIICRLKDEARRKQAEGMPDAQIYREAIAWALDRVSMEQVEGGIALVSSVCRAVKEALVDPLQNQTFEASPKESTGG